MFSSKEQELWTFIKKKEYQIEDIVQLVTFHCKF